MKALLKIFVRAFDNVGVPGRSWRQYVIDFVVAGVPLSAVFLICGILAALGVIDATVNGEPLTGSRALFHGLLTALVIPLLTAMVGSMDFLVTEVLQKGRRQSNTITVGVISDTHGLLRPEVVSELRGSDLVIHAGDVGKPEILEALRATAPVYAVRGNVDRGAWASALPLSEVVVVGDHLVYVVHEMEHLDLDPAAEKFAVVITGHTHRPAAKIRDGVLYLNPGSVGPRRFSLPVSMARLRVYGEEIEQTLIELDV